MRGWGCGHLKLQGGVGEEGISLIIESPRGNMEINFDTKWSSLFTEEGGGMRGRVGGDPGEKTAIGAGLWGPHPDLCAFWQRWGLSTSTILYSVVQTRWMEGA